MSIIVEGTGPIARPITDSDPTGAGNTTTAQLRGPVQLCVNEGVTCGLDPLVAGRVEPQDILPGYCGPPWMRRIVVRITPIFEDDRPVSILDATGQALHCVWRFDCQQDLRACITEQGIRRVQQWSPGYETKQPIFVESNGGAWRIPRPVQLFFGGGDPGSRWNVDVQELLDHNWGPPCCDRFALDTFNASAGTRVLIGMEHVLIQPLIGTLTIAGAAVTTPGSSPEISVAQPSITAGANSLYRTFVAL